MLFGKLHNPMVNYGLTDDEYSKIRMNIVDTNRKNLAVGCYILIVYMLGMALISFITGMSVPYWLYLTGAGVAIITVILNHVFKKHSRVLKWLVYIVILDFLGMGILMGTVFGTELPAVAFPCFLIIAPLIFSDRPYRICSTIVIVVGIFIFAVCYTKEGIVLTTDISNAILFGSVSFILSIYLGRVKIDRFVKERQVYELANFDLLTELQNRNCYMNNLEKTAAETQKSLAVLYIDADNLHEVNNERGHEAGDVMLRSVAQALLRHLDQKSCYRIGGDEFLCLLQDYDLDSLDCILGNITDDIMKQGYHISFGLATADKENLDIPELVRSAEVLMFENKKAYYASMGMDFRNH